MIFAVQLTTSRTGNLTRFIHTLLCVMSVHTCPSLCAALWVAENAGVDPVYSPLFFVFFLHSIKGHLQLILLYVFSATEFPHFVFVFFVLSFAIKNCLITTVCVLFVFVSPFFCFFGDDVVFPSIFVPLPFYLCTESTSYVFSFRVVFFYLVTTG